MSMYSRGGATGGIAGVLVVAALIGARIYSRIQRHERQSQPVVLVDDSTKVPETLEADSLAHAHELMDLAPNAERVGQYLHWAVRTHHQQAWAKTSEAFVGATATGYRDALFDLMLERAAKDGRTEEATALEKVKAASKAAGESWWDVKKK
jgi:hypothetical protein